MDEKRLSKPYNAPTTVHIQKEGKRGLCGKIIGIDAIFTDENNHVTCRQCKAKLNNEPLPGGAYKRDGSRRKKRERN